MIITSSSIIPIPITSTATATGSIIEPMPLLYIRDTPPCSWNLTTYAHNVSDRIALGSMLFSAYRVARRAQRYAGDGSRESVVLVLEALPNC
jgi:hypothetical protein